MWRTENDWNRRCNRSFDRQFEYHRELHMNEHEMRIAELQRRLTNSDRHSLRQSERRMYAPAASCSEAMQRASVAESRVADLEVQSETSRGLSHS